MGEVQESRPHPARCFCQLPLSALWPWARRKYVERATTMQLLEQARTPEERDAVGIVALLDLPDEDILRLLRPLADPACDILACRDHVRRWLWDVLPHPIPSW